MNLSKNNRPERAPATHRCNVIQNQSLPDVPESVLRKMGFKKIVFDVSPKTNRAIEEIAKKNGQSISETVRQMLVEGMR